MKTDLDRLMQERSIDAAVVTGVVKGNATMFYMVNGAAISHGTVIKKRGEAPVLVCSSMEREEAGASGLEIVDSSRYDYRKILKEAGGDRLKAAVSYRKMILKEFGVSGRVAFYGLGDTGSNWALLKALDEAMPDIEIVGEFDDDIFLTARMTKDESEVERIRVAGRKTCEVVAGIRDHIASQKLEGGTVIKDDGSPLTIGDVKSRIKVMLVERRMIEEVDTIFAIGRDAGIPHSRGHDDDVIEAGKTIVFDIFPQEEGGGYFFDMTRTFVVGEASDEIVEHYRQLEECHDTVTTALEVGAPAGTYQTMTCEFFEKLGHETPRTNPQVTSGYVHSLGHGIGLNVHEKPTLSDMPGMDDKLVPGSIFTVEPGLYYPDKGFGMRIEDVYYARPDGVMENLTNFPRELVIEMQETRG
ncbi:MAG: M24 family metallopeptidase [Candidatus Eisenbacteria bacterium]|nr:M24 family metallopeptidase [Candidatus Eisenbacteria bacterium]